MIAALTFGALAWGAPATHVRAVAVPPSRFAELDGRREVRVWWDDDGAPKDVQLMRRGGWSTVSSEAAPGVSLGRLEPGAAVRVRGADGEVSEPVSVRWSLGPAELARLAAPEALPGIEVSDIAATPDGAMVALQEGGLIYAPMDALVVEPWGMAEGLPSARVLAVAVDGERLWIGTDAGLALAESGRVTRTWTTEEGLPDDWVQALGAGVNEDVWVGTYRGLARVRATGAVETVARPLPVYSITPEGQGTPWVGYAGLAKGQSAIPSVDPQLKVWDVDRVGERLYLATETEGVVWLEEGLLLPLWRPRSGAAYALHRQSGVLYVAADTAGLVALDAREGPVRAWGVAEGLPGDAVYEVVGGPPGKLWVGTDAGLALMWPDQDVVVPWPRSPLAAGYGQRAALGSAKYALVGGDAGVVALGRAPQAWADAEALPGPIVHLASEGRRLWVVGSRDAWRLHRGQVERVPLPIEATHAALAGGALFIGGPEGAMRYDAAQERFVALPVVGPVVDMRAGPGGLCWLVAGRGLYAVSPTGQHRIYSLPRAPRAVAVGEGAVWVASAAGLERLDPGSGELDPTAVTRSPARALALDSQGHPLVLGDDGALFDALTGVLLADPLQTAQVGEDAALTVDAEGRVWLLGERGAMLLTR